MRRSRSLRAWARDEGLNYRRALAWVGRSVDPLPTLFVCRRHHVDLDGAEGWLEREARRDRLDLDTIVDKLARELEEGQEAAR
jgi:hypothetical protein